MNKHTVAVVGASGYSGLELTRLLARHPAVRVTALYSDRWSEELAGDRLPLQGEIARLAYRPLAEGHAAAADWVFLATPAEVSADLAPKLLAKGCRVVDLSGAFRLADAAAYPGWYGFAHPAPELLAEARYGLPELARGKLAGVISDGDLRRLLESDGNLLSRTAGECAHPNPRTIPESEFASAALQIMEKSRITSLFVTDTEGRLCGAIHLHDLWGVGLF